MKAQPKKNTPVRSKAEKFRPIKLKVSRIHKPDDLSLEEWQRILRKQYAEQQNYNLLNTGDHPIFSNFQLNSTDSGKTYKIAIRGDASGDNYCSCPDFRINYLGTCKHIEFTLSKLMRRRGAKNIFKNGYILPYSEVYLSYGPKRQVRVKVGKDAPAEILSYFKKFFDTFGVLKEEHILNFTEILNGLPGNGNHEVRCYDDVMEYIADHQDTEHRHSVVRTHFKKGIDSPIFRRILKTDLYPYQREGALFAVNAGRSLIGDDMGLGKTIQALAAAELMAQLFGVQKILIVSPTSLKYQWKAEIDKFSGRTVEVIEGFNDQRKQLYQSESFYKLVNYELIFRDKDFILEWAPDLIILDEAQRIKNWKTRTAKYVKQLESTFAIVLTGTPIENRIEELHSIVEFIDYRHLGPLYRFVHDHTIMDGAGKVEGYKNLQSVRDSLKHVMIRRKKDEVLKQLPERIDKNFFVPLTEEQSTIHDENYDIVVKLVAKWRRYKFLCEADQRRLMIALNNMRMAADNTYLVDKKTIHGPKIEELEVILRELVVDSGEKAVIFSQWLRMTELVERILDRNGIGYVHLNGSVPSKKRKDLMSRFREDPSCMVFLSTDAGGVGLNLQSGSVVINMDIPWNPAVLEQRVGRVHRLGQRKTVRVINFITSASIEERILDLLKFKKSLFAGALDKEGENVVMVGESQLKRFMQSVETVTNNLEKTDSARDKQKQAEADFDEKSAVIKEMTEEKRDATKAATAIKGDNRASSPIFDILSAGAQFLSNLSKIISDTESTNDLQLERQFSTFIKSDEKNGRMYLNIPLPEPKVLNELLSALGAVISGVKGTKNKVP